MSASSFIGAARIFKASSPVKVLSDILHHAVKK